MLDARAKAVEEYDVRRFDNASCVGLITPGQTPSALSCRTESYVCTGNAPCFDCDCGILAAVSSGAPNTNTSARVHLFTGTPRRIAEEVVVKEMMDGAKRVRVHGGNVSILADRERLVSLSIV